MKAWVLDKIGSLGWMEVDKPVPREKEVLVKVAACGICGSDIPRVYKDGAHNMPLIIGHEFSGKVVETGRDVSESWKEKNVGIFPLIPCMKCKPCLEKRYEMCRNYSYLGSRIDGGFAEYVSVPEWNLIELPENVSMDEAAMLEPMAVAVHAMRHCMPGQDETVVVCGLGTIGMLLLMFLLEAGVTKLYAVGNKDFQKETAVKLGLAEECFCDTRKENVETWILEKTDDVGAEVFFECVGKKETYSQAVNLTAPAGRVCLVGNPYTDMELEKKVYWKILRNQLTIVGTWNSSFTKEKEDDWHYVLERLAAGRIHPAQLITHHFVMEDILDGFEIMRDKTQDYLKIMGDLNE